MNANQRMRSPQSPEAAVLEREIQIWPEAPSKKQFLYSNFPEAAILGQKIQTPPEAPI